MDWFITDHLGSTKLLIDQNGQHRFTGDDDPFGINLRSFGDKDTHRFTGQVLDEEQGAYYYGARYYLPEIGRFLSGDPHSQYSSPYILGANDPIRHIDPSGKDAAPIVNEQQKALTLIVPALFKGNTTTAQVAEWQDKTAGKWNKTPNGTTVDRAPWYKRLVGIHDYWNLKVVPKFTTDAAQAAAWYKTYGVINNVNVIDAKGQLASSSTDDFKNFTLYTNRKSGPFIWSDTKQPFDGGAGRTPSIVHEFGHMLTLVDRYNIPPSGLVYFVPEFRNTIMSDPSWGVVDGALTLGPILEKATGQGGSSPLKYGNSVDPYVK